ncbi:hypothetical protein GK047_18665 [Paenibacillus sp. SYP-B3998]|uniref:Uncharacterized protein n=1 Tax=Paenibacillus sp. SYP-B3998 TaxID=2678564 RepID=A0A6G4A0L5_9BACL|nr:hypothetical protein [Paenibacillus sp. SYP-B3998]NEW08026.1 hypothetical protein [Paenibacillus sp. SYP-B3998]
MSISQKNKVNIRSNQRVAILLQDQDAIGKVYAKIQGKLTSKELVVEAFKRLQDGLIYADESCTELIDDAYIEIFRKKSSNRKEEDFVFLIDRTFAEDYIVSAKIIK